MATSGVARAYTGVAVGRLRGAFHLGALLSLQLLGRAGAGTDRLGVTVANGSWRSDYQEEVAEMLIARIILAVAALNLIFLISDSP